MTTSETSMLEKMARELCRTDAEGRTYEEQASAALQAIRDLDDATLRAGMAASWAQQEALREAHRAIIDAILNEEP